jgi:hypothetical protein
MQLKTQMDAGDRFSIKFSFITFGHPRIYQATKILEECLMGMNVGGGEVIGSMGVLQPQFFSKISFNLLSITLATTPTVPMTTTIGNHYGCTTALTNTTATSLMGFKFVKKFHQMFYSVSNLSFKQYLNLLRELLVAIMRVAMHDIKSINKGFQGDVGASGSKHMSKGCFV